MLWHSRSKTNSIDQTNKQQTNKQTKIEKACNPSSSGELSKKQRRWHWHQYWKWESHFCFTYHLCHWWLFELFDYSAMGWWFWQFRNRFRRKNGNASSAAPRLSQYHMFPGKKLAGKCKFNNAFPPQVGCNFLFDVHLSVILKSMLGIHLYRNPCYLFCLRGSQSTEVLPRATANAAFCVLSFF